MLPNAIVVRLIVFLGVRALESWNINLRPRAIYYIAAFVSFVTLYSSSFTSRRVAVHFVVIFVLVCVFASSYEAPVPKYRAIVHLPDLGL